MDDQGGQTDSTNNPDAVNGIGTPPSMDDIQAPSSPSPSVNDPIKPVSPNGPSATDNLIDLKTKALKQLTPLVGKLDQSPEEKFRTTMMMIQASDNQDLIQDAYDAAQAIEDEKQKAQALLDIVNEINYFTQQNLGN